LIDGFKDRADPTGTNLGFYNQIPEIKAVWFSDFPLGANEGVSSEKWTGSLNGDEGRLLLLEIPDEVVQQLDATVRMGLWGRSSLVVRSNVPEVVEDGKFWREYIIPAEVANQYGPPTDITDSEGEYSPNRRLF
tara:strand:+ start:406 stop:807 length:402 start_codon:yes stop_codon:yes gene_type:complete